MATRQSITTAESTKPALSADLIICSAFGFINIKKKMKMLPIISATALDPQINNKPINFLNARFTLIVTISYLNKNNTDDPDDEISSFLNI